MKSGLAALSLTIGAGLLVGCATSSLQIAYESVRPAHGAPLRVEIGREAKGIHTVRIAGGPLLGAVLSGQAVSDGSGSWKVDLLRMDWFNNWNDGWTDAGFVISGSFDLAQRGAVWQVLIKEAPEIYAPFVVTIRYYDDYLSGDKALEQFTWRWNRIEAYAKFLRSRFDASWFSDQKRVRRFLFPELYGYDQPHSPHHAAVTVDSISWNTDYTKEAFPENLRTLRDSGTMLRDFEESEALWDLAFRWSDLWTSGVPPELFHSIKL